MLDVRLLYTYVLSSLAAKHSLPIVWGTRVEHRELPSQTYQSRAYGVTTTLQRLNFDSDCFEKGVFLARDPVVREQRYACIEEDIVVEEGYSTALSGDAHVSLVRAVGKNSTDGGKQAVYRKLRKGG
ncbi:hypothetical protein KSC_071040 [Ktedonobacter sp. SOSP1-52]|nr:hypothetical protein KSC_071040 [Ktedonobacter sp. SOSP1-52]